MSDFVFPPGFILIFGAFLLPFFKGIARTVFVLLLPLLTLEVLWMIPDGVNYSFQFLEYQIEPVTSTTIGRLFATIFAIMTFVGGLYAVRQARTIELSAAFAYAGSAIGVTFAGDLITVFIFWEMMALGSTLVIWSANTESSYKSSMRYLLVHLFGGVVLMAGIVLHVFETNSIAFNAMQLDSVGNWLIMIGFLINAGAPPFSAWIADAYPEASPSGTVFLSAFTTKTAVFTLLVGFPGSEILIYIGLYMVFYGIIYALLENDMRRILAYSIVNQVGFMVVAIGVGTEMALNGAAAHAFAHIIYKGLLLMSAGSVLYMTGKRKCTDLGGLFQTMPKTAINGIVGALAISSFPFTSGFISKSLGTSAAAHEGHVLVWFFLLAASGGVFLHAGIKFPWFVFFQKDSGLRPPEAPLNMRCAMWVFTFFCLAIGLYPDTLYSILPYSVDYEPYTADHLVTQFQLLLFAGFAFFALLPMMKRTLTISLDFDWFYRYLFPRLFRAFFSAFWSIDGSFRKWFLGKFYGLINFIGKHEPEGIFTRTRLSSSMVIWVTVLLASYLVMSFI